MKWCWMPSMDCSTFVRESYKRYCWTELFNTPYPSSCLLQTSSPCKSWNYRLPSSFTADLKLSLADWSIYSSHFKSSCLLQFSCVCKSESWELCLVFTTKNVWLIDDINFSILLHHILVIWIYQYEMLVYCNLQFLREKE